ncbi:MAG: LPP20 family lipoprotein [Gammaproteobacteria bacterium]|nr:LPP20 family lipoprotein [Gammaproteobacteria bacterium]
MKRSLTVILVTGLLMTGCGTTSQVKPDWINAKSKDYPSNRYLIGRGESKRQAQARDRARADLAKIFQVAVVEQSRDIERYSSRGVGRDAIKQLESEASRDIETRTEQVLSGIDIAEIWEEPKTKQFHALAILDRLQTSNRLRQEINHLDEVTDQHIAVARNNSDLITSIGAASRAVESQVERDSTQRILKIVDRSGVGVIPKHNLGKLVNDRDALVKRLTVSPNISKDDIGGLDRTIAGALAYAGFSHKGKTANYILDANLETLPIEDKEGWMWVRASLDINLKDAKTGDSRGSHRWDFKASAQTAGSAKKRVKSKIDQLLKTELKKTIISFGKPE